jgi:hypothetical protein
MPSFASLRDLVHKERYGLQIPVSIGNMCVAKICAQRRSVPGYGRCTADTLFKRANSECMPQVMNAWSALLGSATQSD